MADLREPFEQRLVDDARAARQIESDDEEALRPFLDVERARLERVVVVAPHRRVHADATVRSEAEQTVAVVEDQLVDARSDAHQISAIGECIRAQRCGDAMPRSSSAASMASADPSRRSLAA